MIYDTRVETCVIASSKLVNQKIVYVIFRIALLTTAYFFWDCFSGAEWSCKPKLVWDDEVYDALTERGFQIFMYSFISYPFCYAQAIGNETVYHFQFEEAKWAAIKTRV